MAEATKRMRIELNPRSRKQRERSRTKRQKEAEDDFCKVGVVDWQRKSENLKN